MRQIISMGRTGLAIGQDEREFFVKLGSRITQRRKDSHLTQELRAETPGVSQPTMNAYELGQRCGPESDLPVLAKAQQRQAMQIIDGVLAQAGSR